MEAAPDEVDSTFNMLAEQLSQLLYGLCVDSIDLGGLTLSTPWPILAARLQQRLATALEAVDQVTSAASFHQQALATLAAIRDAEVIRNDVVQSALDAHNNLEEAECRCLEETLALRRSKRGSSSQTDF